MSWTRLQFFDTGKVFYTAPYMQGKGTEYRILFNECDSLEILSNNHATHEIVTVGYFHVSHSDFLFIKSTILISDKPQLLVDSFNVSEQLSCHYSKEFITELIQEYLDLNYPIPL